MRIIAGRWRSRPLVAAPGEATRPTGNRVREALFSMLASRLGSFTDLAILDLFAGTGALALEALSRGAAQAFLVESDSTARRAIEANIRTFAASARLIGHDARHPPAAPAPADLIFLDPPYGGDLVPTALRAAADAGWVAPHTWVAAETARDEVLVCPGFRVDTTRAIGKARLTLLQPDPNPADTLAGTLADSAKSSLSVP